MEDETNKAIIKNSDMTLDLQQSAVDACARAMDMYKIEKDIAEYIKKSFDKQHQPTWHCIVGRNFGSYVTHLASNFIYFTYHQKAILLFKTAF